VPGGTGTGPWTSTAKSSTCTSPRRDIAAPRRCFTTALGALGEPDEVVTNLARALQHVIAELLLSAFHNTERYGNNRVECDHGRLKARLRPMRGLKTKPTATVIIRGLAFMQNLHRENYELGVEAQNRHLRIAGRSISSAKLFNGATKYTDFAPLYRLPQCNSAC
jgi:DDE domain